VTRATQIVIPRPDPLTVLIPAWGVFWGVIIAARYTVAPPASTGGIPAPGVYTFCAGMIASGVAILIGMGLHSVVGLKIKRGANVALGLQCLIYSGWAIQALGFTQSLVIVSWLLTVSVASFWQARRLNAVLNPKE